MDFLFIERMFSPLTQFISLKRISFYLVLFFNIQLTKHKIDLDVNNVYIINEQLVQYLPRSYTRSQIIYKAIDCYNLQTSCCTSMASVPITTLSPTFLLKNLIERGRG